MSLVGTRPPTQEEVRLYEARHRMRLATKPGITGMWQVNGRSNVLDFEEVVRLDASYINEWSISCSFLNTVVLHFEHAVPYSSQVLRLLQGLKLYDLIQFVSRCGMSIYNNIPDYCYEPSQLCILNNMSKVELQSYANGTASVAGLLQDIKFCFEGHPV